MHRIQTSLSGEWSASGPDGFKAGDPNTPVKGIATTAMATMDVLKQASKAGTNLVITYEPTFFARQDGPPSPDAPVFKARLANSPSYARNAAGLYGGRSLRSVGVKGGEDAVMRPRVYTIPETKLGEFASQVKRLMGSRAFPCVGDPKTRVSRILLTLGYATPRMTAEADVVIGGEQQDADGAFDDLEYVADAASLGMAKGLIMLGT